MAIAALLAGQVEAQQPTFRSGVQIVEVDVRVFDKEGQFVANLSRDEFEVIEDGKPQRIDAIYLVDGAAPAAVRISGPEKSAETATLQSAGGVAPQTWIFFFDLNHLTPGAGFERARQAVEEFIAQRFKDGDVAGILAGDKMANNRLTSVRQELLDAVKQVKARTDARSRFIQLTREAPRLLNEEEAIRVARGEREWVQRAVARACSDGETPCDMAEAVVREKAQRVARDIHAASMATLAAMNGLASGLARIAGPKSVVLLSDGFVVQDIETTLRSVVGQMARAGARVYAIDVRGTDRAGQRNLIDQGVVEDPAGPFVKADAVADGPNSAAVDTGGMVIRNENNFGRALDRIAEDAGRYYVLAYAPENTNFDAKYRQIQVRVKRDGVHVRARRGYLALDPARMLKPQAARSGAPAAPSEPDPPPAAESPPRAVDTRADPAAPLPETAPTGAVTGASTASPGTLRLRPDSEGRVNKLSERDPSARTSDVATRAWEAYQKGDLETANDLFTQAAARADVRPWVIYALGMTQAGLAQPNEAIQSWEQVRRAVPDFDPVYMDLADAYAQTGNLTSSLAVLRDAQERWPGNADVLSAIGVIHVRRGALDDGIAALVRAAELTPESALAHLNLARAYALRFHQSRRYVTSQRRWVSNEADREKAVAAFRRSIDLGGPYARQASEELNLLWSK